MNDLDEIKRRIEKRKSHKHAVLTDRHFSKLYNGMIKGMVVLLTGLAICSYVKVSPNGEQIKNYIFNDLQFEKATQWVMNRIQDFSSSNEQTKTVSQKTSYQHIKDNYYTNKTNEVLNLSSGRVIYVGEQKMLGKYITVLLENNIEVTYGQLTDTFVSLYDQVEDATILGTYKNQVMIIFTQGEKEIDYDTFEELIS